MGFLVGLARWELRVGLWRATPLLRTPAPGTAEPGPTPARVLPAHPRDSGGPSSYLETQALFRTEVPVPPEPT